MLKWIMGAVALAWLVTAGQAHAQQGGGYQNFSVPLSTSALNVLQNASAGNRRRLFLANYDAAINMWCRFGDAVAAPAAANGLGSFELLAAGGSRNEQVVVYQGPVNCIAASGTPKIYIEEYR